MKIPREDEIDQHRIGLIVTFSVLIPVVVIMAALTLMFNKQKRKLDLTKANAKANWENEVNATKIIEEDNTVVNTLTYTKQKSSSNIIKNGMFGLRNESSYRQNGNRGKQIYTSSEYTYNPMFDKDVCGETDVLNQQHFGKGTPQMSCRKPFDSASSTSGSSDTNTDNETYSNEFESSCKEGATPKKNKTSGDYTQNKLTGKNIDSESGIFNPSHFSNVADSLPLKGALDFASSNGRSSNCSYKVNSKNPISFKFSDPSSSNKFRAKIEEICNKTFQNV
jgi:hypothetical protein